MQNLNTHIYTHTYIHARAHVHTHTHTQYAQTKYIISYKFKDTGWIC